MRFSENNFLTFLEGALRVVQTSTIDSVQALDILTRLASPYILPRGVNSPIGNVRPEKILNFHQISPKKVFTSPTEIFTRPADILTSPTEIFSPTSDTHSIA